MIMGLMATVLFVVAGGVACLFVYRNIPTGFSDQSVPMHVDIDAETPGANA